MQCFVQLGKVLGQVKEEENTPRHECLICRGHVMDFKQLQPEMKEEMITGALTAVLVVG